MRGRFWASIGVVIILPATIFALSAVNADWLTGGVAGHGQGRTAYEACALSRYCRVAEKVVWDYLDAIQRQSMAGAELYKIIKEGLKTARK